MKLPLWAPDAPERCGTARSAARAFGTSCSLISRFRRLTNTSLYLLVERLNALRSPGVRADDSDFEQQHLARLLAERSQGDTRWHEVVLADYARLDRPDLAAVPTRTLTLHGPPSTTRHGFFSDLYDLLDPVGKFLAIRALARAGERGFDELARCTVDITANDESSYGQRTAEWTNVVVDVWLSEGPVDRDARRERGRPMPRWFVQVIELAQSKGSKPDQINSTLRARGERIDEQTAENLNRLSERRQ